MIEEEIHVVLVDDHLLILDGLKNILKKYEGIVCVGSYQSAPAFLKEIRNMVVDVLITDIDMPEMTGFELVEKVKSDYPKMGIIILTMHRSPSMIRKAINIGAGAVLLKTASSDEFVSAIREVSRGRKYFSSDAVTAMAGFDATPNDLIKPATEALSKREVEIIKFLANGFSAKEIADRLFLSVRTVETHKSNIMKKLEVNKTTQLVKMAYDWGLVNA